MTTNRKPTGFLTAHDGIVLFHHRADPFEPNRRFDDFDAHLACDGINASACCNRTDDCASAHPLRPVPSSQLENIVTGDVRSGFINHPETVCISIHRETYL